MHAVRHDVIQQALVVGDDEKRALGTAQVVDAFGDDFKRVNVKAGVGFIQNGEARLQHRHLKNLVALFLAAGKTLVHRAVQEFILHFHQRKFLPRAAQKIHGVQLGLAAVLA